MPPLLAQIFPPLSLFLFTFFWYIVCTGTCPCVFTQGYVWVCTQAWEARGWRQWLSTLGFWDRATHLAWSLPIQLDSLPSKPQWSSCFCLQFWGFYVDVGDSTWAAHHWLTDFISDWSISPARFFFLLYDQIKFPVVKFWWSQPSPPDAFFPLVMDLDTWAYHTLIWIVGSARNRWSL